MAANHAKVDKSLPSIVPHFLRGEKNEEAKRKIVRPPTPSESRKVESQMKRTRREGWMMMMKRWCGYRPLCRWMVESVRKDEWKLPRKWNLEGRKKLISGLLKGGVSLRLGLMIATRFRLSSFLLNCSRKRRIFDSTLFHHRLVPIKVDGKKSRCWKEKKEKDSSVYQPLAI